MNGFWAKFRAWDRDFGWTYRTAIFVGLLFAVISAPFWIFRSGKSSNSTSLRSAAFSQRGSSAGASSSGSLTSADAQNAGNIERRPLYPYSIIPGGAYSRDELVRAVQNDPVVARHYADFEVAKTRIIKLDHSELMYVSYRVGNNVFWTKHPLFVPAGESILSDGKSVARTRCGNRLSATPAEPVSANQPRPEAMDMVPNLDQPIDGLPQPDLSFLLPPAALFPTPSTPMALGTPINEGTIGGLPSPIPPFVLPVVGGGPGSPLAPPVLPPPVTTPEPSTVALLIAGLMVVLGLCRKKAHLASKTNDR